MPKVLVVDDMTDIVALLTRLLESEGHEVVSAGNGRQALDLAVAERPDVVLLDVMMPGMDGLEVCRRLKADPALRHIPVLLLTARSGDQDVVRGLDAGADDFIAKPFNHAVLAARVRSALRSKQAHDTIAAVNAQVRRQMEERHRIEIEMARAHRLESIGRLAAGLAHELNTPVQYIGDNVRFVREAVVGLRGVFRLLDRLQAAIRVCTGDVGAGEDPEAVLGELAAAVERADAEYLADEVPKALDQALEGAEQAAQIVRAMSAFTQSGADTTLLDINQAVANVLAVCRSQWKDVAEVATELDPAVPPFPCVPGEMNDVVLSLVLNAAQAVADAAGAPPNKRQIAVRTRWRDGSIEIEVEDTGTGIPEEVQPRIFEPFFTTRGESGGRGQGLPMAHAIVRKHGGSIRFVSQTGKGTTFLVRLPMAPNRRPDERNRPAPCNTP